MTGGRLWTTSAGGLASRAVQHLGAKSMDKELPDKHGLLLEMYDERAFSRDVIRELPELAAELLKEEKLLHVQIAVLGNTVLAEVRNGVHLTPKIFAFLVQALSQSRAVPEIRNAIVISFVDADQLQETDAGRKLLEMMPPILKNILSSSAT